MERVTIELAKDLFKENFVGLEELSPLFHRMQLRNENITVPDINYSLSILKECSKDYILILGISKISNINLSIDTFIRYFGTEPYTSEPCFYNQDWYLQEAFIHTTLEFRWYLIRKRVIEESRGLQPCNIILRDNFLLPTAVLCVYTFFSYYYARNELLWNYDYIWCSDVDHNGDRIYVGKYHDIDGVNKNGFSIHRHLAIRNCYGGIDIY